MYYRKVISVKFYYINSGGSIHEKDRHGCRYLFAGSNYILDYTYSSFITGYITGT